MGAGIATPTFRRTMSRRTWRISIYQHPAHPCRKTKISLPWIYRDEALVQALAFFVEIKAVRNHLAGIWKDYKDGNVKLIAASIITDCAFEFLRKPHENFARHVLPAFGSLPDLLQALWEHHHGPGAVLPEIADYRDMSPNDPAWQTSDDILAHDYHSLKQMLDITSRGQRCISKADFLGSGDVQEACLPT